MLRHRSCSFVCFVLCLLLHSMNAPLQVCVGRGVPSYNFRPLLAHLQGADSQAPKCFNKSKMLWHWHWLANLTHFKACLKFLADHDLLVGQCSIRFRVGDLGPLGSLGSRSCRPCLNSSAWRFENAFWVQEGNDPILRKYFWRKFWRKKFEYKWFGGIDPFFKFWLKVFERLGVWGTWILGHVNFYRVWETIR